jgi:glycosyltransferase involved in cell wall biosynthesis
MHLSRQLGVPFSAMARGSDVQYWMKRPEVAPQILEAARAAGGMLAASEALRQVMIGYGFPGERIRTHYTGVDRTRFRIRDRAAEKAKLRVSGPLLVTVGALIQGKGQKDAIGAAELLPGATLLMAGEGPDRRSLEKLIRAKGLEDRVRLLGNRPAVRKILADPPDQALVNSAADKFNSQVKFARLRSHLAEIVERTR